MDPSIDLIATIALGMGAAWASGINLYAALLMLGLMGATGEMTLPPGLEILQEPPVLMAAGFMYFVEFFADKIPGVDTGWDAIHTFIRLPAGAVLAATAIGDVSVEAQLAAAIVGGSLAGITHTAKAGSRVMINTSPEPMSNWAMSIAEDIAVIGGLWAALNHPALFLIGLVVFIGLVIWLIPKIWRGIRVIFRKLADWLSPSPSPASGPTSAADARPNVAGARSSNGVGAESELQFSLGRDSDSPK